MLRWLRHPAPWWLAWLAWAGVLWFLSSLHGAQVPMPIPQFDKFEHFSYFLAGGFLVAGGWFAKNPASVNWRRILVIAVVVTAVVAFIDEWHQCYTPGRSGADPWDWLADLCGGTCGALLFKSVHGRLPRDS